MATVFPGQLYDTNYGLSESVKFRFAHPRYREYHKVGAIGIPGHGWATEIVDSEGQVVEPGAVGELKVKGPSLMNCYDRDPDATAAVLRDGWLLTGDMARQDEDGFIYLVDRKKDVIISGGENIYPVQIEDFLRQHEAIRDAAVIGLPDTRLGEIATAIIELKSGYDTTLDEIRHFARNYCATSGRVKLFLMKLRRNNRQTKSRRCEHAMARSTSLPNSLKSRSRMAKNARINRK